jgi:hypothetical protein
MCYVLHATLFTFDIYMLSHQSKVEHSRPHAIMHACTSSSHITPVGAAHARAMYDNYVQSASCRDLIRHLHTAPALHPRATSCSARCTNPRIVARSRWVFRFGRLAPRLVNRYSHTFITHRRFVSSKPMIFLLELQRLSP